MPATIRDVAKASGVHISTVSRTFSAPHLVHPETRMRVLSTAEALGYRPNRAARALSTGRTHNIGLIVADIANPFFPPLIKAAEAQARGRDHHVFIAETNEDPVVERELVQALAKQVDGVLLCSPRMSDELILRLREEVALVVVNRLIPDLPAVVMDLAQGARAALAHLIGLGHRNLAYLGGPRGSWTNREIRRSAESAARDAGVELHVIGPCRPVGTAAAEAVEPVLRTGATAVLAYNDLMAVGLLQAMQDRGVAVPEDVSVVGIDDIAVATLVRPRLTTIATPTAAAGRAAVDMLLQQGTDRRTTAQISLQTDLVVRDSTARPRRRRITTSEE